MSTQLNTRLNIRFLENRDIDAILAIQSASPETAQWTVWDYNRVADGDMCGWVAEEDRTVAGFLVGRQVVNDLEILNFAVAPDARSHGVGTALLRRAIEFGTSIHAQNVFLEVRESNHAALKLYEQHDFRATGRRPRYYSAPLEDALVLTLRLA